MRTASFTSVIPVHSVTSEKSLPEELRSLSCRGVEVTLAEAVAGADFLRAPWGVLGALEAVLGRGRAFLAELFSEDERFSLEAFA